MATVVNSRDLKLQTVTPRFNTVRARGLYLNTDSSNFVVKADNTILPSSGIIFTAEYSNITPAVSTTPVFTVTPTGAATLTAIDSMHKKLLFSDMLQDKVTVTATITDTAGVTYTSSSEVSKLREPDIGVDISLDTNVFKVVAGTATPGNIKVTIATKFLEFIGSPTFTLTAVNASDVTISGITLVPDVVLPNVWLLDYDDLVSAGVSSLWVKVSVTDKYSVTHTNKAAVTTISDAQYVTVTGEQTFKFLAGSSTPTSSTITLTALLTGGLTTYDWEYWNGSAWVNLSGTQNTSTYSLAYNNAAWSSTTLRVRCLSGSVYDEITVVKLYDGSSGTSPVIGYLTNETIAVASASDGTGYNVSNAYGTFKMFSGTTDVTSSTSYSIPGGTSGAGIYSITQNGLTLTIGIGNGYYYVSGSSWTTDVESFTVRGIYNSVIVDKVFTVSKARAGTAGSNGTNGTNGTNGINGTDGTDGRTYALAITGGTRSFVYNAAGTASSPTTSAAYGMSLTLDGSVVTPSSYTWSATGRLSGTSSTSAFTPTVNQTYSGDNTSVTLSVTHGSPEVTTSLTVPIGIGKVGDTGTPGTKSVIVKLFKWDTSATVPTTDSSFDWSTMTLSLGSVTGWNTSVTSPTMNGQKLYELSKVITVAATYTGTTTVDWNTADAAGPVGVINEIGIRADGSIGPTGPRTTTGYVYYTLESTTAPTTPTASAFDFSTGAFTSLTANWSTSFSVPSASSSTTGEKYWSSRFVVSEATYGGSQTITFATAVTSTNFDGLVTFTNLSTGTNGAGTSTTFIDGGAITAASVTAGKISTTSLSAIQANLGAVTIATAGNVKSGKTTATDTTNAGFFLGYDSPTYTFFIGNAGDTTSLKYDGNLTLKGGVMNVGTTGAVYGGKTTFGSTAAGFFLGYDSTTHKLNIGDVNSSFSWNGSALAVNGGTITGSTVQTASSGSRVVINTSGISAYNSSGTVVYQLATSTGSLHTETYAASSVPPIDILNGLTDAIPGIYVNCIPLTGTGTIRNGIKVDNSAASGSYGLTLSSTNNASGAKIAATAGTGIDLTVTTGKALVATASSAANTNPAITATVAGSNPAIEVIGGGIKFPSTAVSSSNANTLDDYKEATWTPTVVGTSTGIAVGSASYTKIGRAINFTLNLTFTATGTGVVTFTLPQATTANFSFSCFAAGTVTGMAGPVLAWADSGTSTVNINYFNLSTGVMGGNDMATKVKSGTDIRISGTYW